MGKQKQPKSKHTPAPTKTPAQSTKLPGNYDSETIVWRFSLMDHDGPWGWHQLSADETIKLIRNELAKRETLSWHNIKASGSHHVAKDKLIKEAQERLEELKLDDLDELFSLRITAKCRIWGIKDRYVLKILWYDPQHQVCPSQLKNT